MRPTLTQTLYMLATASWLALLWPYPITLFLAGCTATLTLPLFLRLRARFLPRTAIALFVLFLSTAMLVPISVLIVLVVPQAQAGIAMFNQLRAANFQLPPHWLAWLDELYASIAQWPWLEKMLNDVSAHFETALGDIVQTVVSSSFGFVGGTVLTLWLLLLFITFTTLFVAYAEHIKKIAITILNIPSSMMGRFVHSQFRALRGVMLGILLVAMAQGFLCGIGFAFAGVRQPAFWGLLATLVAPIPMVGTALVWLPLCLSLWFTGKGIAAVGLALWGLIAVAGIDNILRPLFLRSGIDTSIVVLIISILCGMASFGPVGLIAGPVLLAFALQAVKEGNALKTAHRILFDSARGNSQHD